MKSTTVAINPVTNDILGFPLHQNEQSPDLVIVSKTLPPYLHLSTNEFVCAFETDSKIEGYFVCSKNVISLGEDIFVCLIMRPADNLEVVKILGAGRKST